MKAQLEINFSSGFSSGEEDIVINKKRNVHQNSAQCYYEEKQRLGRRANMVLQYVKENAPCTDRQVMNGLGFSEMNSVRPRITELIDSGMLREYGSVVDELTKKKVRRVTI